MNFISDFLVILAKSDEIVSSCVEHGTSSSQFSIASLIRDAAIKGLIDLGYPCEEENGKLVLEVGIKQYKINDETSMVQTIKQVSYEEEISEEPYIVEKSESIGESDEMELGPDILGYDMNEVEEPDLDEEEDEPVEKEPKNEQPAESYASPVVYEEIEKPAVPICHKTEMPDHMRREDFTYNFDKIRICNSDKSICVDAKLIAMPFDLGPDDTDFLVCLSYEGKTRVKRSDGNKTVSFDIGGYLVKISGRVDGGIFATEYVLSERLAEQGLFILTKTKRHGDKGHIVLDDVGTEVHLLPVGSTNNSSGFADFIYYISVNGDEKMGDTSQGEDVLFDFSNMTMCLQAKWKGDTLYCSVSPHGEE